MINSDMKSTQTTISLKSSVSTDKETNRMSEDSIIINQDKNQLDNGLSSSISLTNSYSSSNSLFNDKKEVKNFCNSKSDMNIGAQISLTQKSILSCLSSQSTALILQKIIREAPNNIVDSIVKELEGKYYELIRDKNGNYFCSDLIKICTKEQRIMILKELTKTISDDCTHKFATHPIQILIDFSSCQEEYDLILYSFNDCNKLFYASFNQFGSYVIQKIFEHIPEKFRKQLNLIFTTFIHILSLKQFGICCIEKFITFTKDENIIESVINIIRRDFVKIATNNYGNFLIQFMLKKWNKESYGRKLKEVIKYNFKVLSENKYSKYICDLYIKYASDKEKEHLMLLNSLNSSNNNNQIMMNNIINNNYNTNYNNNFINRPTNIPVSFFINNNMNNMINQNNFPLTLNFFQQFNNNTNLNKFQNKKK